METKHACLLLADISGYTRFVKYHTTSVLHAEEIISELLETVIDAAEFPLKVVKLQGDAALLVAEAEPEDASRAARDVAQQVQRLFQRFRERERSLITCDNGCVCEACRNIGQLNLKAVVHYGPISIKRVGTLEEFSGREVALTRSLMTNTVEAKEYVLMTETFQRLSGGLPGLTPETRLEDSGEGGHMPVAVYYFPTLEITDPILLTSAAAFSGRLNQYSFGRMLAGKQRAEFNHLPEGNNNVVLYLGEGIFSGINILKRLWKK
jgi:class 3 adenylate cyclase